MHSKRQMLKILQYHSLSSIPVAVVIITAAFFLLLASTGCTKQPIEIQTVYETTVVVPEPPLDIVCADEPQVPMVITDGSTAEFIKDLSLAYKDCKRVVDLVREWYTQVQERYNGINDEEED